jgi:hypothetical protein
MVFPTIDSPLRGGTGTKRQKSGMSTKNNYRTVAISEEPGIPELLLRLVAPSTKMEALSTLWTVTF